jgi:hypothetical protein
MSSASVVTTMLACGILYCVHYESSDIENKKQTRENMYMKIMRALADS